MSQTETIQKLTKAFWVQGEKDVDLMNEFIGDRKAKVAYYSHGDKGVYVVSFEE